MEVRPVYQPSGRCPVTSVWTRIASAISTRSSASDMSLSSTHFRLRRARSGRVTAVAMEGAGVTCFGHLRSLEADFLRALPQHGPAQRGQILKTRGQRDEVIARELAPLAGEVHAAIGQQNLGFADAAGVKNDLAGRRIAGVVLVRDAEIEIAERHPDPLAAPAHMDRLALERHRLTKSRARLGRQLFLETGMECEVAGVDNELAHLGILVMADEVGRYRNRSP